VVYAIVPFINFINFTYYNFHTFPFISPSRLVYQQSSGLLFRLHPFRVSVGASAILTAVLQAFPSVSPCMCSACTSIRLRQLAFKHFPIYSHLLTITTSMICSQRHWRRHEIKYRKVCFISILCISDFAWYWLIITKHRLSPRSTILFEKLTVIQLTTIINTDLKDMKPFSLLPAACASRQSM
jgi:hypothetical protein